MSTVWESFKWLVNNLVYVLALIGLAAVVVRVFDEMVERKIAARPESRLWRYLDNALDCGEGVLGFVLDVLHRFALRKKAPADEPKPSPQGGDPCPCQRKS